MAWERRARSSSSCCTCQENSPSSAPCLGTYLHLLQGLMAQSLMEQVFLPSEAQQHFGDAPQRFSVKTLPLCLLPLCPGCCPMRCTGCIPLAAGSSMLTAGTSLSVSEMSAGSARVKNKSFPGRNFHTAWGRLDPQVLLSKATSAPQPCTLVFSLAETVSQEDSSFEQLCMKTQGGETPGRRVCQTFHKPLRKFDFIFPSSVTLTR